MVMDKNSVRCDWRIGRITNPTAGAEGLVRNVEVTLGNKHLDSKGRQLGPPTTLRRAVSKIVLLLNAYIE